MARKGRAEYEYVRAFVEKDWGLPERLSLANAAAEHLRLSPAGSLAIGDGLRIHGERLVPDDARARAADFASHEQVSRLLARASRVLQRR